MSRFVWGAVLAAAVLAGVIIALMFTRRGATPISSVAPGAPQATWAAGAKRAPEFALIDQSGHPVSIARFRGRPIIVTFIDPLCRNLCPLEAKVINSVEAGLPTSERPAVVSVSVERIALRIDLIAAMCCERGAENPLLLAQTSAYSPPRRWSRRVDPSMSVNRKVTVPR